MSSTTAEGHQQHPLGVYFKVWVLLFVLSFFSYMVDYIQFQGWLRWSLVLIFMFLKAGFIIAIFMHMAWERLALVTAILVPPMCLLIFIAIMGAESEYTWVSRMFHFLGGVAPERPEMPLHH
jgi:cytochrome c oxidase subunit IV